MGCVHSPAREPCCRLAVLGRGLGEAVDQRGATPARDLGGVTVKQRLVADAVAMEGLVGTLTRVACSRLGVPAVPLHPKKGLRLLRLRLRRLCRLAARFTATVERGVERGTIDPALGGRLVALAGPHSPSSGASRRSGASGP